MTNELIKAIDEAEAKVRIVRDMAVESEQWWLYASINKAVSSIIGITSALLEQKTAQQTEQEATTDAPKHRRVRANGQQSEQVLAP